MAKLTIVDERKNLSISVHEIEAGEIFNYDGRYFIMVEDQDNYLAIDLENGKRCDFYDCTIIMPVNATLIIE